MQVGSRFNKEFLGHSKDTIFDFFLLILIHFLLLAIGVVIFNELIFKVDLLNPTLKMDAGWYWNIRQNGYHYTPGQQSNVAFYPLFPWVWRWTGVGYLGIVLINIGVLLFSLYLLVVTYEVEQRYLLLLLATPSLIFSFVPYSESIFFLGATLLIIGFNKSSWHLILIGSIISCLTRSASAILVLCLVFTYLLCEFPVVRWQRIRLYIFGITAALTSSMVVRWVQISEAGVDFSLFEVQSQWNRHLGFPSFPITTTTVKSLVWNDFLAMFVGLLSGLVILYYVYQRISYNQKQNADLIISMLYIAGITCVTLLFSGTYGERGTSVHSLNRFIFSTPFFTVFLIYQLKRLTYTKEVLALCLVAFGSVYLSFIIGSTGQYASLRFQVLTFGYFLVMAFILVVYLETIKRKSSTRFWVLLYGVLILLQSYAYCAHLSGLRVG